MLDKEPNRALDNNEKKILKNALATSFYSTNTTVDYIPRAESGWDLLTKINGRDIILDSNTPGAFSQPYFVKMSETGVPWLYKDGSYVEFPEQMFYCMIPHPTVEKVVYENYILFDDELGMQTSIVAGHLDDAIYNEETHFYDISNIQIHHSAIATHYLVTPTEDTMVFNFGFKLSSDESYVTNAYIEFVSSESFPVYNGFGLDYVFGDMHSTIVDMPN